MDNKGKGKHRTGNRTENIFLLNIKLLNEVGKIIVVTLGR